MKKLALVLILAACGSSSSKTTDAPGGGNIDAPGGANIDAPGGNIDAPSAPAMITISGTASARSVGNSTPVQGAVIAAYKNSDETTPVAMATTDASGNFTLTITTGGVALDGYIKATASTYMDTYVYPPKPVTADLSNVAVNLLTPQTFNALANMFCGANETATDGAIAVEVLDSANMTVAGATVASTPAAGKYCYDANGFPSRNATATDTDGVAFMFKITGQATVSAAKAGATFLSHSVNARAGAFTTTLITE
jgi:hypothetical protein